MTFFDKKEEVMKIELTPYGRYLLSIGKLKPHSYRFFDENVIYDSNQAGFDESQNEAHLRIKEETPILKTNPNITGVETNIKKFESVETYAKDLRLPTLDDVISTNNESVGTNEYVSKNSPYYKVELYRSEFLQSLIKSSYTSKNVGSIPIPQLPLNYFVSASVQEASPTDLDDYDPFAYESNAVAILDSDTFGDDSYITVRVEEPLIKINEINGFDTTDRFMISAFKVKDTDGTITYQRLKFDTQSKKIINDILLDDSDIQEELDFELDPVEKTYTPDYINYYLQFTFDKQIPDEDICSTIGDLEVRNIYLDERIDCPDVEEDIDFDIYASRVRRSDLDDEACD